MSPTLLRTCSPNGMRTRSSSTVPAGLLRPLNLGMCAAGGMSGVWSRFTHRIVCVTIDVVLLEGDAWEFLRKRPMSHCKKVTAVYPKPEQTRTRLTLPAATTWS